MKNMEDRPVVDPTSEIENKSQTSVLQYLQKDMQQTFVPQVIPKSLQVRLAYHPAYQPCEDKEVMTLIKKESKEHAKALSGNSLNVEEENKTTLEEATETSMTTCDQVISEHKVQQTNSNSCTVVHSKEESPKQVQLTPSNESIESDDNDLYNFGKSAEKICEEDNLVSKTKDIELNVIEEQDSAKKENLKDYLCQLEDIKLEVLDEELQEVKTSDKNEASQGKLFPPIKSQVPKLIKSESQSKVKSIPSPTRYASASSPKKQAAKEVAKPKFVETFAQAELETNTLKQVSEIQESASGIEASSSLAFDCKNNTRNVGVQVCFDSPLLQRTPMSKSATTPKGSNANDSPIRKYALPVFNKNATNLPSKPITPKNPNSRIPFLTPNPCCNRPSSAKLTPFSAKSNYSTPRKTAPFLGYNSSTKAALSPQVSTPHRITASKYRNIVSPVARYIQMNPSPSLIQNVQAVETKMVLNMHRGTNLPPPSCTKEDTSGPALPYASYTGSRESYIPPLNDEHIEKIPQTKFLASQKENTHVPIIIKHTGSTKSSWSKSPTKLAAANYEESFVEQVPLRYANSNNKKQ